MPQRIADAARIAPFLMSRHEPLAFTQPDNARVGQTKSAKKNKLPTKEKRPRRCQEESASSTGPRIAPVSSHAVSSNFPRPIETRSLESTYYPGQRHFQETRYSDEIPDYPPPTFQEAISSPPLSVCPSTTTLGLYSSTTRGIPEFPPILSTTQGSLSDDSDSDGSLEFVEADRDGQRGEAQLLEANGLQNRGRASLHPPSPINSQPKRRHMSLSPLRTLLPHKPVMLHDRALSAQPASPYSFARNVSLFRSTTSLKTVSTGSFFRLPLSSPSSTSLTTSFIKPAQRVFSKGKERFSEPLDDWEVLNREPPPSLMSAVESFTNPPSPESATPSPTQNSVFTYDISSLPEPGWRNPLYQTYPSPSVNSGIGSLTETSLITPVFDPRQPESSTSSLLPSSSSSSSVEHETHPELIHNPTSLISGIFRDAGTPSPSLAPRKPAPPSPLSLQSWGAAPNSNSGSSLLQLALETPLPLTPVDSTIKESKTNIQPSHSHSKPDTSCNGSELTTMLTEPCPRFLMENTEDTEKDLERFQFHAPPNNMLTVLSPVNRVIDRTTDPEIQKPIAARLQLPFPSVPLSQRPSGSPGTTPTQTLPRHHYPGRPLPKVPPSSPEPIRNMVDSLYAPHPDTLLNSNTQPQPSTFSKGFLIDFNESPVQSLTSQMGPLVPSSQKVIDESDLIDIHIMNSAEPPLSFGSAQETEPQEVICTAPSDLEELSPSSETAESAYSNITDLDVLHKHNGTNYDTLHLLSRSMSPAVEYSEDSEPPPRVYVSLVRRQNTLTTGQVKTKLSLLDVTVDKCGVCMNQFRENDSGAMNANCQHPFHESCLRRWLALSRTCPLCRVPIGDLFTSGGT